MLVPANVDVAVPQAYLDRQATIAAMATGIGNEPYTIEYTAEEHATWASVQQLLEPAWERNAALPLRSARASLDLSTAAVPQLSFVSDRVTRMTGFRYAAVPGTVSGEEFFGSLARQIFPSTQFIRWSGDPSYTRQPDIIHEITGHGASLAVPLLAELHHLAGRAFVAAPQSLPSIAAVFWYSIEFGVISSRDGWKAYGTGLLSSPGELGWFTGHAEIRALDITEMLATPYDINRYQPILFGADSLDHVAAVVGGYFQSLIELAEPAVSPSSPPHSTQP